MEKSTPRTEDLEASASSIDSGRGDVVSGTFSSWGRNVLLSVETRGIERVTEVERQQDTTKIWNACTFWLSANMAVATLNVGTIGGAMGLAFWDCFAIIVIVNVLACLIPAWTAGFGLSGLRMTTFSRYSFGYWGNLLVVIFSMVSTTGWNAINSISGASVLYALSNGTIPTWAGVILICTIVWIICALGINAIHKFDAYLWIPPFLCWCVAAGTGARNFTAHGVESPRGADGAAAALSFMAVVFSFAVSWINCAADYNVRMPLSASRWKIGVATYIGIAVPTILVQALGAALYTGTETSPIWKAAFKEGGVGGPLKLALEPAGGFGKLLLAFAALSSIPNNIPNNYSFAMHAQNFGPWAIRIPRIILVTFGFICAIIVGCFAAKYFTDTLQTFLSIIGYWTIIHLVVVAEEHIFFRGRRGNRWEGYDWDAWNRPELLPFGWAAIGTFLFGFAGAVLGMKVGWFVGPVAKVIGRKGANVGHELTFAFSGLAFPVLRVLEKRFTGK